MESLCSVPVASSVVARLSPANGAVCGKIQNGLSKLTYLKKKSKFNLTYECGVGGVAIHLRVLL
jgi:hypothetical protein